ncbi:hypothetical protein A8709_32770 [Paenibacillus pectinilyticus]|uniref:ABC transporter substrate-binding protein n=1 Tax=Paenibacillus pectinilyticus TaxID=512399 RepID=A0A1C0ZWX0_9BACL|nr:extracellular solute-binding protein [Paenibacillus pectinilyticus]OCT12589.1 hypothetical protein A8709_32770 [Paenibacillus pectinilyticus]
MKVLQLKKPLYLSLAVVMSAGVVLSGCSSSTSGTSATSSTTPKPADTAAPSAAPAAGKQKLVFWHTVQEKWDQDWWTKWIGEYNKSQDKVEVDITFVPGDAWDQKLKAAQAAGTAPEIWNTPLSGIAQNMLKGTIKPLDDLVDPKVWDDLTPNGKQYAFLNGKHWGFPKFVEPSALLLYRKDLFQQAGLDPESPPTTWAQLIEDGKKLTKGGVFGINMPTNEGDLSWTTWGMQAQLSGHLAISDDWSKANVTDAGHVKLANFFKSVFDAKIAPAQTIEGYSAEKPFAQAKVAMTMGGSWTIGQLKNDYPDQMKNIGVSFFPTEDGDYKKPTASLGGWSVVIDANSKHPKEDADFLTWMFARDPNVLADYFKRGGYTKFSPWKSVDQAINQDPAAANDPYRKVISEKIVQYAVNEPLFPWDPSLAVGQAINRVLLKNMDPQQSFEQADKQINDFIAKNNVAAQAIK